LTSSVIGDWPSTPIAVLACAGTTRTVQDLTALRTFTTIATTPVLQLLGSFAEPIQRPKRAAV